LRKPLRSAQLTFPETDDTPACTTYLLEAINNARSVEGLSAMVLPSNWYSLTTRAAVCRCQPRAHSPSVAPLPWHQRGAQCRQPARVRVTPTPAWRVVSLTARTRVATRPWAGRGLRDLTSWPLTTCGCTPMDGVAARRQLRTSLARRRMRLAAGPTVTNSWVRTLALTPGLAHQHEL